VQRTLPDKLPAPRLVIGGEDVISTSGGVYQHHYAATGEVQSEVPLAGPAEVDAAVAAARAAFPAWRGLDLNRRRDILQELARLLVADGERLGAIATLEVGTPNLLASSSSAMAADWFTYYAGWIGRSAGEVVPVPAGGALDYVLDEPLGVIAAIIPWNGPLISIGMKVAPALAAGNCVVLKTTGERAVLGAAVRRARRRGGTAAGRAQRRARRRGGRRRAVLTSRRRQDHLHRRR